MGRVFTTTFQFKGQQHSAVVYVVMNSRQPEEITVKLLDNDLHQLIPKGTLKVIPYDNEQRNRIQNRVAAQLFVTVKKAVLHHLSQPITA